MMDCGTTDIGKGKKTGITQSTIVHMASERLIVYFVVEMAFVSTRNRNTLVRIVKVVVFVSIMYGNMSAGRDVVDIFVTMGKKRDLQGL